MRMVNKILDKTEYMDLYDEDPNEIEYNETMSDHICDNCGRYMEYDIEEYEIFGAITQEAIWYCPNCD